MAAISLSLKFTSFSRKLIASFSWTDHRDIIGVFPKFSLFYNFKNATPGPVSSLKTKIRSKILKYLLYQQGLRP